MWNTITRIKKTKYILFKHMQKINLKTMSKNLMWKNSKIIEGINYISPKDKVFKCISSSEKINDNEYLMRMYSSFFSIVDEKNMPPKINIDFSLNYVDIVFCLRKYVWMYNRPWRGFDDAMNRVSSIYFKIEFFVNGDIIGSVYSNTRSDRAYGVEEKPISIIIYNKDFSITTPIFIKEGAKYKVNHTNSVDYFMDIGANINIYTRKKLDKLNFEAKLSVEGWVSPYIVTTESFINIKYMYESSSDVTTEGVAIFYEDR